MQTLKQQPAASAANPKSAGLLQRKSAATGKEDDDKKKRLGIQTKLKVSQPGDPLEEEADRVADQVVNHKPQLEDDLVASDSEPVEETGDTSEIAADSDVIQRKGENNRAVTTSEIALEQFEDGGSSLPAPVRRDLENKFGADFSHVRVHTDSAADSANRQLSSLAFTRGNHIAFRSGKFAPGTVSGKKLLAHELTHVLQQNGGVSTVAPNAQRLTPITGAGPNAPIQRKPEVQVQVNEPNKVRIVDGKRVLRRWNKVSAGNDTVSLMKKRSLYEIYKKRKPNLIVGKWGLNYFSMFHGGYGFHSNIAMKRLKSGKRRKIVLTVDGKRRSHGCIRMFPNDAKSFYAAVSVGTPVRLVKTFPRQKKK